jgi:hypothetical protein
MSVHHLYRRSILEFLAKQDHSKPGSDLCEGLKAMTSSASLKIDCTLEDANKLLLLTNKVCPDVVVAIAKGITTSLKSD